MVYMQHVAPSPHMETYQAFTEPVPMVEQPVPPAYTEVGRTDVQQMPTDTSANGQYVHGQCTFRQGK